MKRGITVWLPSAVAIFSLATALILFFLGELTQPIATVLAATIITFFGFVGFRYQKFLDRGTENLAVKRELYARYLRLSYEVKHQWLLSDTADLRTLRQTAEEIYLVAGDNLAEIAFFHLVMMESVDTCIVLGPEYCDQGLAHWNEEERKQFSKLLDAMRQELDRDTEFDPSRYRKPLASK